MKKVFSNLFMPLLLLLVVVALICTVLVFPPDYKEK